MEFGVQAFMRKTRKRMNMNQEQMAERMHVTQSTVAKWESGRVIPKVTDFFRWVKQTESNDLLMATMLNIDMASNVDLTSILDVVADLFSGVTVPAFINLIGAII